VDNANNVKLLGANPPNKADTLGNYTGTLIYYYDGSTYWRIIGAVWVYTNNTITTDGSTPAKWYQIGNFIQWDTAVAIVSGGTIGWTLQVCTGGMPAISICAEFQIQLESTATGAMYVRPHGSSSTNGTIFASFGNWAGANTYWNIYGKCFTDSSQQIDYSISNYGSLTLSGYYLSIR
jgi:hypothetical protein